MNSISVTRLYNILSEKLGDETAENLTLYLEERIRNEFTNHMQMLATKEDLAILKSDLIDMKSDILKWMFVFWIGQTGVTFGFILLYLKK